MVVNKEEEIEKFNNWIIEMDDRLEPLLEYAEDKGYSLDYSLASLAMFEEFVKSEKINFDHDYFITCARYLGEVVRKNFNGQWDLDIDDPRSLYFKRPVIINYSKYDILFSPIHILKNYTREYNEGLLLRAIMSDVEPTKFNLDEYPTEEEEPEETKEEFEVWLATMGDEPDQLIAYAKDKGYRLDYTLASLDTFKEFVKSEKINTNHSMYNASGRYLGEVVRRNYKDDWRHGTRVLMYNILNEQY